MSTLIFIIVQAMIVIGSIEALVNAYVLFRKASINLIKLKLSPLIIALQTYAYVLRIAFLIFTGGAGFVLSFWIFFM